MRSHVFHDLTTLAAFVTEVPDRGGGSDGSSTRACFSDPRFLLTVRR